MSQSDIHNPDILPGQTPEPIAPMPENLTDRSAEGLPSDRSVVPQSRDAKTVESSTVSSQHSDSSDVIVEASTVDRTWETVNFPNSMNVDELEVSPEDREEDATLLAAGAAESIDVLPIDYEMMTIAQSIEAHKSVASMEEQQSAAEAEFSERIEHLETVLSQYQRSLEEQKLSAQAQQAQIDEKIRELQVAEEQIQHLSEELEGCHEEIRSSQMAIATLSENWQESQQRLAQVERECATTHQRYNEQVQLNRQAANTCRELRSRLHRQQRQALQFKAALEKSLDNRESLINSEVEGVASTDRGDRLNQIGDVASESSLEATEDSMGVSLNNVLPNSVPIEPWSNSSEIPLSDFGKKPEEISGGDRAPSISPTAKDPELSFSGSGESTDLRGSVGSWNGPIANDTSETFWPEENNLIQTIRDMVSTEGAMKGGSDSGSESIQANENPSIDTAANPTELNDGITSSFDDNLTTVPSHDRAASDTDTDTDSSVELDNYLLEIPEVADPMNSEEGDRGKTWPAPVVYPQRSIKKRRSLASVELPSFPTKG